MNHTSFLLCSALLALFLAASDSSASSADPSGMVWVAEGMSTAPIIVPGEDPTEEVHQAANDLAGSVERITGRRPEIIQGTPDPLPERAVWVVVSARASYLSERATAMELFKAGKFQEAADAFIRLGEGIGNDVQQADALTNAALALQQMKRPDEAMAVAEKIRSVPLATFCRISLLRDSRQWDALLKLTKDEDFSVWPEKVVYPAYMARAQAQASLGHAAEAESDALRAQESTISPNQKAMAWDFIAERSRIANEPPEKALDAYEKIIGLNPTGRILQRALYNRALLLTDLKQWDQARADISQLENLQKDEPHWNCVTKLALGYLAEKQGQTAEALASYREAAAIPKAPEGLVNEAKAKIAALEAAPKGETPEVKN